MTQKCRTGETINTLVRYVRDNSGKAISMLQGANTYYFIYNGHGDVTSLTDESGNIAATYSYDEFGNLEGIGYGESGTEIYNPLRYSGANNAYYDEETGLYKMGVRYYQSDVGRWITRDNAETISKYPSTYYKYVYVDNNPLTGVDPTGYAWKVLGVPRYKQSKDQWCWAASAQMVIAYKKKGKKPPKQAEIVKYVKGSVTNKPASLDETTRGLRHWGVNGTVIHANEGSLGDGTISYSSIIDQIGSKKLIISGIGWYGGGGHMVVIKGYNTSARFKKTGIIYNDPADGKGHGESYDHYKESFQGAGRWVETIANL